MQYHQYNQFNQFCSDDQFIQSEIAVSDKFYVLGLGAQTPDYSAVCQVGVAEKAMIKALEAKIGQDDKEILKQYKEFKTKYPDGLVRCPAGVLFVNQEHISLCYQHNPK